uniref:Solute carrier family 22 member 13-like n=1 Tax=Petromyzon marinus TaxID=7757 RepID=A0AAJ7T0A3_PETMA|nr:solute carrier family 22 member 13-like [Petromyzon marinus]
MEPTITTDFGDIIATIGFGKFQKWLIFWTSLTCLFGDFPSFVQVFSGSAVPHRCRPDSAGVTGSEGPTNATPEPAFATPSDGHGGEPASPCVRVLDASLLRPWQHGGNVSSGGAWSTLAPAGGGVAADDDELGGFGNSSQEPCTNGWMYDTSQYSSTIVTEFDLVCERRWLNEMSQAMFMLGFLLGSAGGPLSDSVCFRNNKCLFPSQYDSWGLPFVGGTTAKSHPTLNLIQPRAYCELNDVTRGTRVSPIRRYGRKGLIVVAMVWHFICGLGSAFSPNVALYIVFRFGVGLGMSFILGNPIVLIMEWCSTSKRTLAALVPQGSRGMGQVLLATLAYFIRDWRMFQLVVTIPPFVAFIVYSCIVPESARWLYTRGDHDRAKELIMEAAKQNGVTLPTHMVDTLSMEKKKSPKSALDLFRTFHMRQETITRKKKKLNSLFLYCFVRLLKHEPLCRLMVSMSYYKLSLSSTGFGLSIYLTQLIFGVTESPARFCLPWFLERFGRRPCIFTVQFVGGLACVILALIPADLRVVTTVVAVLVKTCMACAFSVLFVYSTELFPTTHRQNGLGMAAMSGSLGGILAPMVSLLGVYHRVIPLTLVGAGVLVSSLLCLSLPETRNVKLPDVLPTKEDLARKAKLKKAGAAQNGTAKGSLNVFTTRL